VAPNGDIYVADGYGSQWILQFSAAGEFIRRLSGKGDEDHQCQTAHGVCLDLRDAAAPVLVCTSRGHNAFKLYSLGGEYQSTVFLPGAHVCRAVIAGDMLYAGVCWSPTAISESDTGFGLCDHTGQGFSVGVQSGRHAAGLPGWPTAADAPG